MSDSSANPISPPAPAAAPVRIRHVDSLRAVAAGLVVWLHYAQFLAPLAAPGPAWLGFLRTVPQRIDVGRVGVLIFFAISGFVICRSFGGPREGGARRFLIRRLCRLYPAYWVSFGAGCLAWLAAGRSFAWQALVANVTMAPSVFAQPYVLGVFWTLEIELLFYCLCLGLYAVRRLEHRGVLAALVLCLAWLNPALRLIGPHIGIPRLGLPHGPRTVLFGLAVMCWGALFRLAYDATGGFRRGALRHGGTWLVAALLVGLIEANDPGFPWFLPGTGAGPFLRHAPVTAALLIFTVWVACLRVDNRALTFLGVVSYSLYLFHLILMMLCQLLLAPEGTAWRRVPFWADFLGCAGGTVALAAVVYRWVERPAIALGKRWAALPGISCRGKRDGTV